MTFLGGFTMYTKKLAGTTKPGNSHKSWSSKREVNFLISVVTAFYAKASGSHSVWKRPGPTRQAISLCWTARWIRIWVCGRPRNAWMKTTTMKAFQSSFGRCLQNAGCYLETCYLISPRIFSKIHVRVLWPHTSLSTLPCKFTLWV